MTTTANQIDECSTDAAALHALLQGLEIVTDAVGLDASPASNAFHALVRDVASKADKLAEKLDVIVTNFGKEAGGES